MKKIIAIVLCIALSAALFVGCGSPSTSRSPANTAETGEKSVTFSLLSGPISLDPATTTDGSSLMVEIQLFNTLVYSKGGTSAVIEPELATDWEVSDDGLVYTFHLRDDVTFHDGKKFTAADAVYTFERVMVEPYTSYLAVMIDSVEALDDYTFQATLLYPFADFLMTIGGIYFGICSEDDITAGDDFMYKPVGTGPYKLEGSYVPGQSFSFVYNENYWGPEPDIKRINFRILPDTNTAVIALQNGEVDFVPSLTVNDIATVDADPNLTLYQEPSYTIHYVTFNKTCEPFSVKEVREAINYAINKEDLLIGAVDGVGSIANSPINSLMLGYTDKIPFNEYNVEAAKAKLAEAGYPDGFSCSLMVNSNNNVSMKMAQIIQNQLAAIGINVTIEELEKATWSDKLTNVNFEFAMATLNWSDTNNMVTYLYHTQGTFNYDHVYSSPEMDSMIDEASRILDTDRRIELYNSIAELGHEDMPIICLLFPNEIVGANKNIDGIEIIDNCVYPVCNWTLNQ